MRDIERTLFKVEHLEPNLRKRNGRYGYYGLKIAETLEKKGHGKILHEGHVGSPHETKVLTAGGGGHYLVKGGFKGEERRKERVVLERKDLYGDQEESDGVGGEKEPAGAAEPDGRGEKGSRIPIPRSQREDGGAEEDDAPAG